MKESGALWAKLCGLKEYLRISHSSGLFFIGILGQEHLRGIRLGAFSVATRRIARHFSAQGPSGSGSVLTKSAQTESKSKDDLVSPLLARLRLSSAPNPEPSECRWLRLSGVSGGAERFRCPSLTSEMMALAMTMAKRHSN